MDDIEQPSVSLVVSQMQARLGATHLTMLSSLDSSFNKLISRIDVLGTPSSSASSLIFLSATKLPDVRSRALYTTPYVPVGELELGE